MTQKDNGPGPSRNYGETGVFTLFSHWLLNNNKCNQYFHFSHSASSLCSLNCMWNKCKQWAKFECRGPRILFVKIWNSPAIIGQSFWGLFGSLAQIHLANLMISLKKKHLEHPNCFLIDCRVRKRKNLPDCTIFDAKTFGIKRVNPINFQICDKCA